MMQHVATCDGCSTFWSELQAAQRLTLQLPRVRLGEGFHEELWERIRAGEGTPEAVFHEPVPVLAKVRYALTGAAAAAAVLACMTWLRNDRVPAEQSHVAKVAPPANDDAHAAAINVASGGADASGGWHQALDPIDQSPLIASMQRLRFNTLAVETAKQLEQRYSSASRALRRTDDGGANGESAVRQVFENADDLHSFGEFLLAMCRNDWLFFTDPEVGADLRLVVDMLGQSRLHRRDRDTLRSFVAPALRTARLANVSDSIGLKPLDPRLEMDVLARLNRQWTEVFPKLFIVFGTDDAVCEQLGLFRNGTIFVMEGQCGPSWVAPRSEVEARDGLLRLLRAHARSSSTALPGGGQQVEVHIEVPRDHR